MKVRSDCFYSSWRATIILIATASLAPGCSGGLGTAAGSLQSTLSSSNGGSASTAPASVITITSVIRDQLDPNGTLDIVGDNTTSMGTYCVASGTGAGNTGPSTCTCNYTYTLPLTNGATGSTSTTTAQTTYHDGNLLKCSLSAIPSGVTTVSVSVVVTSDSNNTSNLLSLNLSANSSGLSLSSPSSYAQVIRYTCRDTPTIPNVFDTNSGIYDPLQSEAPTTSYPLDFYATNLGLAINAYAGGISTIAPPTSWECPSNPLSPPAPFHVTIYSETALNGSKIISGLTSTGAVADMNAFNARSTFYLANAETGVFDIPVNAYVAPTIHSYDLAADGSVQGGVPPIGYGAAPIAGTTAGTESCPANIPIPSGYTWVKVWLFRAALPSRVYLSSTKLSNVGNIDCNAGLYPNFSASNKYAQPDFDMPFNSCYNDGGSAAGRTLASPNGNGLASRYFEGSQQCVDVIPSGTTAIAGGTANLSGAYSSLLPTPAIGTDLWTPVANTFAGGQYTEGYGPVDCTDSQTGAAGTSLNDYLGLCSATSPNMPTDPAPAAQYLDTTQRYDFLFVVTPSTVMTRDMSNSQSSIYQQYAPYRFRTDGDCGQLDPDAIGSGCNMSASFQMYGIKFYDVGSSGDSPSTGGVESFPICALQPTS